MRLVVIESPYAGNVERNLRYLRACLRDALLRGEAPFASHGLYTQDGVLDDNEPEQREMGIKAGLAWRVVATPVFYVDLGWSKGMRQACDLYQQEWRAFEVRKIGSDWEEKATP